MKQPNLQAMQVPLIKDADGSMKRVRPGDTNLKLLSRAAGYKLRGKSSYHAMPAKKEK